MLDHDTTLKHLELSSLNHVNLGAGLINSIVMENWPALQTLDLADDQLIDITVVSQLANGLC